MTSDRYPSDTVFIGYPIVTDTDERICRPEIETGEEEQRDRKTEALSPWSLSASSARARELQPQCRTGLEQSDRPVRLYRLDQLGCSLDHTNGPFVDLIEPFDHPIAQKQKARGSVKSGPPFAVVVQWRKTHKTLYSKRCSPMALTVAQSRRHIQFTIRRERLHPLAYVGVTFTGFADTLAGIVGWLS